MAHPFDLNVRLEEDAVYGNVLLLLSYMLPILFFFYMLHIFSFSIFTSWTGFDLNLPLNEFGAVDLDWLQNMPG